jgi:hypothetical protein
MPLNTTYGNTGLAYDASINYDGILLANAYTDLETVKARLGIVTTDTAKDTWLSSIITAVSRWIDGECKRFFYTYTGTRYYTPKRSTYLDVDDFVSLTSVTTDIEGDGVYETTWAATDYLVTPFNARDESPAQPYNGLQRAWYGAFVFPITVPRSVAITASWGYDSIVPIVIQEATILQTARIFRRSDAPFGVTGSADMGQSIILPRLDPDVRMMLAPYKRWVVA